jgi:hypothetical protein
MPLSYTEILRKVTRAKIALSDWNTLADDVNLAGNPPRFHLRNNANVSIPTGQLTVLNWNTELYDSDNMHAAGGSIVTCVTPGVYRLGAQVEWEASGTGGRLLEMVHSSGIVIARSKIPPLSGDTTAHQIVTEYPLALNDTVSIRVLHSAGVALLLYAAAAYTPEFWGVRIGN